MFGLSQREKIQKAIASLREVTLGDLMTDSVISCLPEDSVVHAATKLIAEDISCLVVMKHGELKGILSERDFLHKVPFDKKVFEMTVSDIMTPDVVTAPASMLATEAVALMKKHNFRRLVVEHDKGYSLVTMRDFNMKVKKLFPVFPEHEGLSIKAFMGVKVHTVKPTETFSAARNRMKKFNVGSILIEDKGSPKGIFTEYDVVMQFYDQEGKLKVKGLDDYLRKYVRAAPKMLNVFHAIKLLMDKRMRRLPVADGEKIVGIITQRDVVQFIYLHIDELDEIAKKVDVFDKHKKDYVGEFVGDRMKVYTTD